MPEADAPVVWGDFEVRLDRLLGRGGMGSVYEARQISLDRIVAIKTLDTDRAPTDELAEGFLEKFQHEAQALAKLNDPRIVTILQAGRADGKCWYAMELVDGVTVDQRISESGALLPAEAARVAAEVARALSAALAQGIIHRDVKPANIFLTADGRVKLGDFGLARSGGFKPTRFTEMNSVAGTPEYASPEQAANGACDHRSDQYSLGAVLFEMVTERPPFGGANALETFFKHAHEPPPLPRRLNPEIPPRLEATILRCLEKDPARRFPGYDELIRELEAVRSLPAVAPGGEPEPPAERPKLAVGTAVVAAIVLVGFAIFGATRIFSSGPRPPAAPAAVLPEVTPPAPIPPPPAPRPEPPPPARKPEDVVRELLASGRAIEALRMARAEKLDLQEIESAARDAAWAAVEKGDEATLAAYLQISPDEKLKDELSGMRDPFNHPRSAAGDRAIRKLYADRDHRAASTGELKEWKKYPGSAAAEWESGAAGLRIRDASGQTWLARELPINKGFTVTFRFSPKDAGSWAGVAVSPMSPESFRLLHVRHEGGRRIASLVKREAKPAARGEREVAVADSHELVVIPRDGRFACYADGAFIGWEEEPGPGGVLSIGVNRSEIEITEVRIAR